MDLLAISRDLAAADTVTHKGTAAAVGVLRPLFQQAGMGADVQAPRPGLAGARVFAGASAERPASGPASGPSAPTASTNTTSFNNWRRRSGSTGR